jgi:hypothetical protein
VRLLGGFDVAELEPSRVGTQRPSDWASDFKKSSYFKKWKLKFEGQRIAPKYDFPKVITQKNYQPQTPPTRRGETAQQMPNYPQLTPNEKAIYEWLPGFSQSTLGQALTKFGEGPFGKVLSVLDVGAEFVERAGGLGSQFWNARNDPAQLQDLRRDVTAAWYAGSLASDMTNLPTYKYDDEGRISGMSLPADLPGAAGIAQARKDISNLVAGGATYSEALQEVKSGYYDSLGALQMRAQLYDLYQHILLDPLNIVMPYVKPIERLRVASELASTTKWADDVLDANKGLLAAAKIEGNMEGIVAVAQKTQKLVGKTATAFKKAQDAGDIAKAAKITEKLLDDVGITRWERIALYLTGKTDPLKPQSLAERLKFGGLTPEARASELMTTVSDNIGAYILGRADDPYQWASDINRAASGAVGPEMGHAFVTREGRAVQGLLGAANIEAQKLIGAFDLIKDERAILGAVADALGVTKEKVMGLLADGDFAGVARMSGNILDAQQLDVLYKTLKDMPFSEDMFKFQLMNKIADVTAQQGVLMFGVKQRGFAEKLAGAVKAAETLAFLRINPAYFVKNALNNEMTIIGRGMGVNMGDIETIVRDVIRFESPRMRQGFGMIGDALGAPTDSASRIISDAARGERGFLDKMTDAIGRIKPFGKLDMGYLSSRAERSASTRAFVTAWLQGYKQFWKAGKGYTAPAKYFPGQIQDMINTVDRGILPALDQAIGSAKYPEEIIENATGNLNISMRAIIDDASARLGYKVDEVLPDEFLAKMEPGFKDAVKNGTIREFMTGERQRLQEHLDELAKHTIEYARDKTTAKLAAEGPAAFPRIWGDQMDEWHGAAIQHAMEMEEVGELVRLEKLAAKPDWERIHRIWQLSDSHSDAFYTRLWDRWDGTVQGMVKGAKAKGIAISDDVVPHFKQLKRGWRGWWKNKRKLQGEYFEATTVGKKPPRAWEDISAEIKRTYDEMVKLEDTSTKAIDQLVAQGLPENLREPFLKWRGVANELRRTDKEGVSAFRESLEGMSSEQRAIAYEEHWRQRIARYGQMRDVEHMGESAMMGDAESIRRLERASATLPEEEIAKLTEEDLALAEGLEGLPPIEEAAPTVEDVFIHNINSVVDETFPYAVTEDTYWFTRGNHALDGMERAALDQAAKPPLKWTNLPKEAKEAIEGYLAHAQGQMGDARYAATRFAEYKRDAALLNYNRRYKFDTYASMIFPYQFWFTHSAAQWAIHSIDRPAMLSSFLRIKEFMNTAGAPGQALPQRLRGTFRIGVPFLPEEYGDSIYTDPLRTMFPFDTFLFPFEKWMQRNSTLEGRTEYILNDMLENGEISQEDLDAALAEQSGPLWLKAREMAIADDDELKFSAWDMASLISGPHAPLQWAYNVAMGTPEDIGPFTPASRTIKGAMGLMGVDWDRHPMNMEGRLRTSLGLPAFDKWDDYRVDRMLSNMVAMNEITIDQALRAMIEREGDAYDTAIKKANFEFGIGAAGSVLGMPSKAYPEGEYLQRSLVDDYQSAWAKTEETGEMDFVNNFNRLHPEYEARLALWKSPEERMRSFLTDEIWNIWFDMPKFTKGELIEQLGEDFEEKFVNKETRSYDSINLNEMAGWLKLMGGDPPGTLESEPAPIDLADPEVAWRVQVYRDTRDTYFPDELWDIQDAYFDIPEDDWKAKKAYREQNPMLSAYWEWRRDWMHRNPETVPYLQEGEFEFEYSTPEAEARAEQPQPWLTWDEWSQYMGPQMTNLMEDHFIRDYEIPSTLQNRIDELAGQLGLSYEEALNLMEESLTLR